MLYDEITFRVQNDISKYILAFNSYDIGPPSVNDLTAFKS